MPLCIAAHRSYDFVLLGNSNLVYQIIRKRAVFHQLANLPVDQPTLAKVFSKKPSIAVSTAQDVDGKTDVNHDHSDHATLSVPELPTMEGAIPAAEAAPGTLNASLAATPGEYFSVSILCILIPLLLSFLPRGLSISCIL